MAPHNRTVLNIYRNGTATLGTEIAPENKSDYVSANFDYSPREAGQC